MARKQRGTGLIDLIKKADSQIKSVSQSTGIKPSDLLKLAGPKGSAAASILGALGHGKRGGKRGRPRKM